MLEKPLSPELRQRLQETLRRNPSQMTLQLARDLDVPEVEVIRAMPEGRSVEMDISRWQEIFERFAELGKVHVIVSNSSTTCEVVGEFGGFSTWGEFFNVQTPSLDMHLRPEHLAAVFAVEKPSHLEGNATPSSEECFSTTGSRRVTLSFQFFDRKGDSALKVFLNFGGKPTPERSAQFASIREQFRKS